MRARAAKSPGNGRLILWAFLSLTGMAHPASAANAAPLTRNNFGTVGMIDMPSAGMAPDGEFSVGASFFQKTQHYNFNFQVLPWLETSFRYSGLQHFDPAYPVYYDRSFAIKARLWDQTKILPAVAFGINDAVGTGIYSGEYLVASKRVGDFDATLGVGWGRLGSTALFRNPLTSISKRFENRPDFTTPGGTNFNVFLHGPNAGLFGGVVWHTPVKNLSLIVEYSSDNYSLERSRGGFTPRNQMNYGASYQIGDNISIGLDWLYGRSVGGNILFQLNPAKTAYPAKLEPAPVEFAVRSLDEQQFATQTILRQNRGISSSLRKAGVDRGNFVDALWRQKDVHDVEVRGASLVLTTSGDAGAQCITAAQLAEIYGSGIRTVMIRAGNGQLTSQCVTNGATLPAYISSAGTGTHETIARHAEISTSVIDAVGTDIGMVTKAIRSDARAQKIAIEAISLTDSVATVYYGNIHYFEEADALDRLTRLLMKDVPPGIEKFRLIAVVNGVPQQEFNILRGPQERKFSQTGRLAVFDTDTGADVKPAPLQNPILAAAALQSYPRFSWSLFPQLRQELFDPDNPFAVQLTGAAIATLEVLPGLTLNGEAETSLFDNFSTNRRSDSVLPHVRSDFLEYFARGKTGIGELDAQYRFRLAPTIFAVAKAGYLESMFAGAGGEVLWRPEGQRWALGGDAYQVWQRGFDRLLDLQKYNTFTGHISLYYASPWHELNFILSAGQYLAGDRGLSLQVTRRFSTGVEIGAFFTKTNISATQFGEGSFDKGIVIRIPLGWALPVETQGVWGLDIRPVQRDGGQRLMGDAVLFEETRRTNNAGLLQSEGALPY